jgi:hypothetical protein
MAAENPDEAASYEGGVIESYVTTPLPYLHETPLDVINAAKKLDAVRRDYGLAVAKANREAKRGTVAEATIEDISKRGPEYARALEAFWSAVASWNALISKDWAETLKSVRDDAEGFAKMLRDLNQWTQPKVTTKGRTNLGSPLKFEVVEVSRKNLVWSYYRTTVGSNTYRVSPADVERKTGWRIDVADLPTWTAVNSVVYRTPKEAAAALAQELGVQ